MPFTKKNLEDYPIHMASENDVWAIVGPCSATSLHTKEIPLDGRKYLCGGVITFNNGQRYRASFYIDTSTFNFLVVDSVFVFIDDVWYNINESELLEKLELLRDNVFPFTWLPDRELDYHKKGPYMMKQI